MVNKPVNIYTCYGYHNLNNPVLGNNSLFTIQFPNNTGLLKSVYFDYWATNVGGTVIIPEAQNDIIPIQLLVGINDSPPAYPFTTITHTTPANAFVLNGTAIQIQKRGQIKFEYYRFYNQIQSRIITASSDLVNQWYMHFSIVYEVQII